MSVWDHFDVTPGDLSAIDQEEARGRQGVKEALDELVKLYRETGELSPIYLGTLVLYQNLVNGSPDYYYEMSLKFAAALYILAEHEVGITREG